jgi:hypothetical protein
VSTVQEKLAWLDAVRRKVQKFVDEGGDLKSEEAAQLGVTLYLAVNDFKSAFGIRSARSFNGSQDAFPTDPTSLLH